MPQTNHPPSHVHILTPEDARVIYQSLDHMRTYAKETAAMGVQLGNPELVDVGQRTAATIRRVMRRQFGHYPKTVLQ